MTEIQIQLWQACATSAAVLVALFLPLVLDWRQRRRARSEQSARHRQAASLLYDHVWAQRVVLFALSLHCNFNGHRSHLEKTLAGVQNPASLASVASLTSHHSRAIEQLMGRAAINFALTSSRFQFAVSQAQELLSNYSDQAWKTAAKNRDRNMGRSFILIHNAVTQGIDAATSFLKDVEHQQHELFRDGVSKEDIDRYLRVWNSQQRSDE